jgi:hypothetical protein
MLAWAWWCFSLDVLKLCSMPRLCLLGFWLCLQIQKRLDAWMESQIKQEGEKK